MKKLLARLIMWLSVAGTIALTAFFVIGFYGSLLSIALDHKHHPNGWPLAWMLLFVYGGIPIIGGIIYWAHDTLESID